MSRIPLVVAALVAACGLQASARAQDAAAGKSIFHSQCSLCHSVEPGRNLTGPSLSGIVGSQSGTVRGFYFSPALKNAHLTWDPATLDRWLTNPRQLVPGTIMPYAGLKDPKKRADLIAYLATLH